VFFLLTVKFLAEILVAVAGVPTAVVFECPFPVEGSVTLHGREAGEKHAGVGVEVDGEDLGGGDVASNVTGGGWKT
jgi:hypothetical protein